MRNKTGLYNIAVAVCLSAVVLNADPDSSVDRKSAETEKTEMVLNLREGSRLVGVPSQEELSIKGESYSEIDIPCKLIENIDFSKEGTNTVVVSFRNMERSTMCAFMIGHCRSMR